MRSCLHDKKIKGEFNMSIKLSKVIDNYNLKEWIPEIDADSVDVTIPEINRPALQLAGFFDHFAHRSQTPSRGDRHSR